MKLLNSEDSEKENSEDKKPEKLNSGAELKLKVRYDSKANEWCKVNETETNSVRDVNKAELRQNSMKFCDKLK